MQNLIVVAALFAAVLGAAPRPPASGGPVRRDSPRISIGQGLVAAEQKVAGRSESVLVRSVIDGDTIDVSTVGRVRLLGIDAPEIAHRPSRTARRSGERSPESDAPFAREARDRLMSLLLHRWIRLEYDGPALDTYQRHLAYVLTEDGQFVNALMVREGLARVSVRVPLSRLDELQRAERDAQSARRGMWGDRPRVPLAGETPRTGSARRPSRRTPKARARRSP